MSDEWEIENERWSKMTKSYTNDFEPKETVEQVIKEYKSFDWPERKIRKETMEKFGVKCTLKGTPDLAIHKVFFPYKMDGKVVGYKVKDLTKQKKEKGHFYTIGHVGVDCELFGQDHCAGPYNNLRIVEGECKTGDSEIFTNKGWVRFDELEGSEEVLQINENLQGSFVRPSRFIKKDYDGYLINFEGKNYKELVTENHKMVCYTPKNKLIKEKANELKYNRRIPKAVVIDNNRISLTNDQIALQLAVSADCTLRKRKNKNSYAYFNLTKERKVIRLLELLENTGIEYTKTVIGKKVSIYFTLPDYIIDKKLPESWLIDMSLEQRRFVLNEQVNWDGNEVPHRNQVEFSSVDYNEALWMHTMCHTAGYSGSIMKRSSTIEKGAYKDFTWYKVSILFNKKTISTQKALKREKIKFKGTVYCVTVPEGRILTKYKDCISVCGNCDHLSAYQALLDKQQSNSTPQQYRGLNPQVVSIGCGTVQAVEHIANNNKFIDQYKNIYLCFDNDKLSEIDKNKKNPGMKGEEATQAVGSFLLYKNVYKVKWPEHINDCSDAYQKGENLAKILLFMNEEFCAENIVKFSDIYSFEEAHKPVETGFKSNSFPMLTEKLKGFRNYELTTISTFSSVGKSTVAFDIAADSVSQGYKPGLIFLEEMPKKTLFRAEAWKLGVHPNKYKFNPFNCGKTKEEIEDAWVWANKNFRVFNHFGGIKTSKLMEKIRYLVFSQGCNPIIFDHISLAISSREDSVNDTKELDIAMGEIGAFCAANPVHIFVISHVNRAASSGFKREDKPVWRRFEKEFLRGSCVDCETEYLGEYGWKKFPEYSGEKIFQYNKDKTIELISPSRYINEPNEFFYHFRNTNYTDMMFSPNHKMVYVDERYPDNIRKITAQEVFDKHNNLKRGFKGLTPCTFKKDSGTRLFDNEFLLRLQIAVNADGKINNPRTGYCTIRIKKGRKKARLRWLLNCCGIKYVEHSPKEKNVMGFTNFYFIAPLKSKGITPDWFNLDSWSLSVIFDEYQYWDGCVFDGRFSSIDEMEADFIQFVIAANGYRSHKTQVENTGILPDSNRILKKYITQPLYRISKADRSKYTSFGKTTNNKFSITKRKGSDGRQYCFTVPSGMFLARRNGKIFVTGNSSLEGISWNIIGIHREDLPNGGRGRIQLSLLKNREADWIGDLECTCMDEVSGRFVNADNWIYDESKGLMVPPSEIHTGY